MKRFFFFLLLSFVVIFASAEMQQGYTKTRGKLDAKGQLIPGQRLSGVIVETDRGKVTSEKDGAFSLAIPNGKFVLKKVDLKGYILNDFEQLRQYSCSAEDLVVVMVKPEEFQAEQVRAYNSLIETLETQLHEREDEIFELYENNKITAQERAEMASKLYETEQSNQKLVEEMAERYAKTDFDQLDDFRRKVTNFIVSGQLTKADSLLNTRGSIEQRRKEILRQRQILAERETEMSKERDDLAKSKAATQLDIEDFAADCFNKHEIYATKHYNDSAAYYLELRASIDTTNGEWHNEAGEFIQQYIADYEKAME